MRELVAECRYLCSWAGAAALFVLPLALALSIGRTQHYPTIAFFGLFLVFFIIFGCAGIVLWLRVRSRFEPGSAARYGPVVLPIAVLLVESYWIATSLAAWRITSPKQGVDCFALLCASAGILAYSTLRDWRSRYLEAEASPVPAFTLQRREQFAAALEVPNGPARRQALRPLVVRGYIRLALLAAEVGLMLVLAPHIGIGVAFAVSFAIVGGTFFIAHKTFDL